MRKIVVVSILMVLYVIGIVATIAESDDKAQENKNKSTRVSEVISDTEVTNPVAVVSSTTTTRPVRVILNAPLQEDDEQYDCQQELGVNYCEVDDLEVYYYGGDE